MLGRVMNEMKPFSIIATILFLASCTQIIVQDGSYGSRGNERVNILILGEDFDPASLPRNHRAFERVTNAIATEMQSYGFSVYDETALTLGSLKKSHRRRADHEVIDIARSVDDAPIDVAVIYTVYPQRDERAYTTKIFARVEGRMVDVRTGRRLGNFNEETTAWVSAPTNCRDNCLYSLVGRLGGDLAREVGRVLSIMLDDQVASNIPRRPSRYWSNRSTLLQAYRIVLIGFQPQQVTNIEDFISAFEGYVHHRIMQRSRETRKIYWYETKAGSAKMDRSLRLMLDDLGIRARIKFERNTFFVNRI